MEEKLIEDEVATRVEALVSERVEEELKKRRDEIEAEVLKRVEEVKQHMEKEMLAEMQRQREKELADQKAKEVTNFEQLHTHTGSHNYIFIQQ